MKKICIGCVAYGRDYCDLGYKTKILNIEVSAFGGRTFERMIPLEQCPKPRTSSEYFFQKKLKIKKEY